LIVMPITKGSLFAQQYLHSRNEIEDKTANNFLDKLVAT
jgi:hypothetical protein